MAQLGNARMVIWFEVAPEVIAEHDHWHAQEHMYERLGIPGFLRGRRAIVLSGARKYFVTYEVESFDALKSPAYLKCLNNPSPWTRKMMPHVRSITRSLCRIAGSFGSGIGQAVATIRFAPQPNRDSELRDWLAGTVLPALPAKAGMLAVHFLEAVKQTSEPQTNEQKLRGGRDQEADWVLIAEGYDPAALGSVLERELHSEALAARGAAPRVFADVFSHNFVLTREDLGR